MKILGISAYYHDSAASLLIDGSVVAAAQEERFTRIKHDADFPQQAVKFCLQQAGLHLDDLDAIVFYEKPFLKFERLLETYYAFAPRGLFSFLRSMPLWLNGKLLLKRQIKTALSEIEPYNKQKLRLLFSEHHLSHAASAFYPSPFEEAAILTIDGAGEWCTTMMASGKGKNITVLKEMNFPHSVGLLYSAFTYFLGFTVNSGEYKLMGLAPYGNSDSDQFKKYSQLIKTNMVDLKSDGSIWLDQSLFRYATGLRMIHRSRWEKLFGFAKREDNDEILQHHCDLALAIQKITEEIVLKMAQNLQKLTGSRHLCLAGGVALNCVANACLQKTGLFDSIFVQPAAGDAGGSLGAALAVQHLYFDKARTANSAGGGVYLGPEFSETEIETMCSQQSAKFTKFTNRQELNSRVAAALADGKIVGWFQGRMEFGPRALGNRSILADARNSEMQKNLNLKIKYRESFRPFAPAVLEDKASLYFETSSPSPYMLFTSQVKQELLKPLPADFKTLGPAEKLNCERSTMPAVTHLDNSARIQTVTKQNNETFWSLLQAFEQKTGCALLVNTSFNVRGEPIVCTPFEAYRCFMSTGMDVLVIGDFMFLKEEQDQDTRKWEAQIQKD